MHKCGQCKVEFDTEAEYLSHFCDEMGVTPQDNEAMGPNHAKISAAALERGRQQQSS